MRLLSVFLGLMMGMPLASPQAKKVELGGKTYFHYRYVVSSDSLKSYNAFDISRAYLSLDASLSKMDKVGRRIGFHLTTDLTRLNDLGRAGRDTVTNLAVVVPSSEADGYLMRFLKYAYLEFADVRPGLSFRFGQSPAPWAPYEEKIWGYRWVEKVFADTEGKLSSTDMGVSALYSLPRGFGSLHFALVNGEGYHVAEPNKYKDLMGRISFHPFVMSKILSGMMLHLYYGYGVRSEDVVRNRGVVGLSWDLFVLRAMGEYLFTEDGPSGAEQKGAGKSFFLSVDSCKLKGIARRDRRLLGWSCGLFFRYDKFDPDTSRENDAHSRMILGYQRLLERGVGVSLNYRQLSFENEDKTSQSEAFLNFLVKY